MKSNFTEMVLLKINKTVMRTDEHRNLWKEHVYCELQITSYDFGYKCSLLFPFPVAF